MSDLSARAVPLNKIPQGLLDFFGIKSGEWGPRVLGQTLAPVLELGRWYLDTYALEVAVTITGSPFAANVAGSSLPVGSTTPVNLSDGTNIIVPQNEVWLILQSVIGWNFTAIAGQEADCSWTSRGITLPSTLQGFTTSIAAHTRTGTRTSQFPYWARPGDTISPVTNGLTIPGGTITIFACRLRIARFQI